MSEPTDGRMPLARFAASQTFLDVLRTPRWASPWWVGFLGLAVAEVCALFVRIDRVPTREDWRRAEAIVRREFRSKDVITVAPRWADPVLRLHLGDLIGLHVAGRSSLAPFERLWVLSIRGARSTEAPARAPNFVAQSGRVSVQRFDFGPSPVLLDLVEALPSAQAEITRGGVSQPCPWQVGAVPPARGGLGFGPVTPGQRFVCDARVGWMWVGATVIEDLDLEPRRCVFQHPHGREPVSVTFPDVPLGRTLVLHGGLDYHRERDGVGAPVTLRALVDGQEIGRMVHRDGDGMKRVEFSTRLPGRRADNARGSLRIEVTSTHPARRLFCWAGTLRDGARRETP